MDKGWFQGAFNSLLCAGFLESTDEPMIETRLNISGLRDFKIFLHSCTDDPGGGGQKIPLEEKGGLKMIYKG